MNSAEILTIVISLVVICITEISLSLDNAAVLAVIVNKNLPENQRTKALRYGMIGAYVFRGLSLLLLTWILANPTVGMIFKVAGGLYLLRLGYQGLTPKQDSVEEGEVGWVERAVGKLGINKFWSTVIICEFCDVVFSIDNLVAVVSLSKHLWVICIGVFIGIAAMRFIAGVFSKLMQKFPSLEISAYVVILLLGVKLVLSGVVDYFPSLAEVKHILESHIFDLGFSVCMMAIFFIPMLIKRK